MIDDIVYKIARKCLSVKQYALFSGSYFGRIKRYNQFKTFYRMYKEYEKYMDVKNKIVVEVGSGKQFYTAILFLLNGAKKVFLVDQKMDASLYPLHAKEVSTSLGIDEDFEEKRNRICHFAFLSDVPPEYNSKIDIICSHFVLEHFKELSSFFEKAKMLLGTNGVCFSSVDLTDNTYHIFDDYKATQWIFKRRALHHLRYSDRFFKSICDKRTYVNRLLLPEYLKLAKEHSFVVE